MDIEIVGIIALGLDPILSPAIYAIGLIIILFYAHSFKLVEPRLTIYYKYIIYSFLMMIASLIAYSILPALFPLEHSYWESHTASLAQRTYSYH